MFKRFCAKSQDPPQSHQGRAGRTSPNCLLSTDRDYVSKWIQPHSWDGMFFCIGKYLSNKGFFSSLPVLKYMRGKCVWIQTLSLEISFWQKDPEWDQMNSANCQQQCPDDFLLLHSLITMDGKEFCSNRRSITDLHEVIILSMASLFVLSCFTCLHMYISSKESVNSFLIK